MSRPWHLCQYLQVMGCSVSGLTAVHSSAAGDGLQREGQLAPHVRLRPLVDQLSALCELRIQVLQARALVLVLVALPVQAVLYRRILPPRHQACRGTDGRKTDGAGTHEQRDEWRAARSYIHCAKRPKHASPRTMLAAGSAQFERVEISPGTAWLIPA